MPYGLVPNNMHNGTVNELDELALAARDGNRFALDAFTRKTLPAVQSLCRHLGDPDTADDLVQETYARMMRSLPKFRGDGSSRSWLLRIARNTCADATCPQTPSDPRCVCPSS